MRIIKLLPLFFIATTSCGYDGGYRYPCQEPSNWESKECNPPICKVDGACTKDLLGFDPTETTIEVNTTQGTVAP